MSPNLTAEDDAEIPRASSELVSFGAYMMSQLLGNL